MIEIHNGNSKRPLSCSHRAWALKIVDQIFVWTKGVKPWFVPNILDHRLGCGVKLWSIPDFSSGRQREIRYTLAWRIARQGIEYEFAH
jgi:hypothetical protein